MTLNHAKSRLAKWNLTDVELENKIYEILVKMRGEPSNASEMSKMLYHDYGLDIQTNRIPHIVKESKRINSKRFRARSDYAMVVFWV